MEAGVYLILNATTAMEEDNVFKIAPMLEEADADPLAVLTEDCNV